MPISKKDSTYKRQVITQVKGVKGNPVPKHLIVSNICWKPKTASSISLKIFRQNNSKNYNCSHSCNHKAELASLGIRQSPRGLKDTEPTLGPSGRQERLNC